MDESSEGFQCISDNSEEFDPYDNCNEPIVKDDLIITNEELAEYSFDLQLKQALKLSLSPNFNNSTRGPIYKLKDILEVLFVELALRSDSLSLISRLAQTCDMFYQTFKKKKEFILSSLTKFRVLPEYFINKSENIFSTEKSWMISFCDSPQIYAFIRYILIAKCLPNFYLNSEDKIFGLIPKECNCACRDVFFHFTSNKISFVPLATKLISPVEKFNYIVHSGCDCDEDAKNFLLKEIIRKK